MNSEPDREYAVTFFLEGIPREHPLVGVRQLVGRAKNCDLCFPFNSEISRLHATFALEDGAWFVEDMASRSGTYVNGERLSQPRRMRDRDVLTIGNVTLTFRAKIYGDGTVDSDELQSVIEGSRILRGDAQLASGVTAGDGTPAHLATSDSSADSRDGRNFYELLGLPLFEGGIEKISQAGKQRLRELREGSFADKPERLEAETGEVSKAIVCLTNPDRKLKYDLQLAEKLGCEVEVRGNRVVPKERVSPASILMGIVVIVALFLLVWFIGRALIDLIAPLFDQRNLL